MESALVIQEFHISITPVGPDLYLLRTEAVAAGVPLAETQVTWPVEDWLAQAASLFADPLQALMTTPTEPEGWSHPTLVGDSAAMQLGQELYQSLFQGRIRDSWVAAQGVAQNRQQPLRLRLGFKDSRLQRLPWELMYGDDRPLATGMDVTLCRYYQGLNTVDLATLPPLADPAEPLNVLVVVSAPDDQERLALSREIQQLMADLRSPLTANGGQGVAGPGGSRPWHALNLQLTLLEQPGRAELVQTLEQGNFQVLHYAGHSDVGETGGDLFLVNRHSGLTEWLSGKDLAGLLVNNGIWLTVFNSCRGAYTPEDDVQSGWREQNLVQALVNRGVPGVIAMADRIPDDVAITFTQLLYRNLRQGYPVDLCLSRVRQGLISAHRSSQPLWVLPWLYLRPGFDGYLYASASPPPNPADLLTLPTVSLEPSLIPPDYSTDPDISSLAQEVFSGHAAAAPVSPTTAINDWLSELESPTTDPGLGDSAAVANLVQQLSTPSGATTEPPLPADPSENLLPQWDSPAAGGATVSASRPTPTAIGSGYPSASAHPAPAPGPTVLPIQQWVGALPQRVVPALRQLGHHWPLSRIPRPIPRTWLWGGAGVVGFIAAVGLGMAIRPQPQPSPPSMTLPESPSRPTSNPSGGSIGSNGNGVTIINGVQALTTNHPAQARRFIEQLLDQHDLEAAQSVLAAADPDQLLEPDLAFVRGRLAWQQSVTGVEGASPYDAQRAWYQALEAQDEMLEAWIAQGFAHYVLADYNQAIAAWDQAIRLDQRQLRDIDPDGPVQVSSALTTHALAGMAMALYKQSEDNPDPAQRQQQREQANNYLLMVVNLDPKLLDPNVLAQNWLWTPALIEDWRTTIERLAASQDG